MTLLKAGTEVPYTVTYLQMDHAPSYDWPHLPAGSGAALLRAVDPPVWYFRALYDAVGRDYAWEDMPLRSDEVVADWMNPDRMTLWTLIEHGWPYGFFMLDEGEAAVTDMVYFGLVPDAIGKGFGQYLLRTAVLTAWQREGLERLTVDTCTLDHPRALSGYQRAGFTPVRREEKTRVLRRDLDLTRIPD